MTSAVPTLYNRPPKPARLSTRQRFVSCLFAIGSLAVLLLAISITPNPKGLGTHRQLNLAPCNFQSYFNIPCPTCGMTTSFAYFVRGNLAASFYVQPMGMILAACTFLLFWFSAFEAVTGKNLHTLLNLLPVNFLLWCAGALFITAWVWKIVLQLSHHDGWNG